MERQRQLEWEKQRSMELQQQRQKEQETVLKLKGKNQSLSIDLQQMVSCEFKIKVFYTNHRLYFRQIRYVNYLSKLVRHVQV